MSDQSDFETHLPAIQAIPQDAIQGCSMPIDVYLLEAEELCTWVESDRSLLENEGLDAALIDSLPGRIGALRVAEGQWQIEYSSRKEAAVLWAEQSPRAFGLRDELLRVFRFAFRRQPNLLKQVANIAEGHSNSDMLQDLTTLAILGRQNAELMAPLSFDIAKLDTASEWANTMSQLLANANGEQLRANDGHTLRDQAYTHLKAAVDEIRDYGKFVFYNNETRLKGYTSAYFREQNRKLRLAAQAAKAESEGGAEA